VPISTTVEVGEDQIHYDSDVAEVSQSEDEDCSERKQFDTVALLPHATVFDDIQHSPCDGTFVASADTVASPADTFHYSSYSSYPAAQPNPAAQPIEVMPCSQCDERREALNNCQLMMDSSAETRACSAGDDFSQLPSLALRQHLQFGMPSWRAMQLEQQGWRHRNRIQQLEEEMCFAEDLPLLETISAEESAQARARPSEEIFASALQRRFADLP